MREGKGEGGPMEANEAEEGEVKGRGGGLAGRVGRIWGKGDELEPFLNSLARSNR